MFRPAFSFLLRPWLWQQAPRRKFALKTLNFFRQGFFRACLHVLGANIMCRPYHVMLAAAGLIRLGWEFYVYDVRG